MMGRVTGRFARVELRRRPRRRKGSVHASIIDMTLPMPVDEVLFDELRTDFLPRAAQHSGFRGSSTFWPSKGGRSASCGTSSQRTWTASPSWSAPGFRTTSRTPGGPPDRDARPRRRQHDSAAHRHNLSNQRLPSGPQRLARAVPRGRVVAAVPSGSQACGGLECEHPRSWSCEGCSEARVQSSPMRSGASK